MGDWLGIHFISAWKSVQHKKNIILQTGYIVVILVWINA